MKKKYIKLSKHIEMYLFMYLIHGQKANKPASKVESELNFTIIFSFLLFVVLDDEYYISKVFK